MSMKPQITSVSDHMLNLEELIERTKVLLNELWQLARAGSDAAPVYAQIKEYERMVMRWQSELNKLQNNH